MSKWQQKIHVFEIEISSAFLKNKTVIFLVPLENILEISLIFLEIRQSFFCHEKIFLK